MSKVIISNGSLWLTAGRKQSVSVIDQRLLPFREVFFEIRSPEDAFFALREMVVRGAPLIGVTAAFGMFLSLQNDLSNTVEKLRKTAEYLNSSRPTAVNLFKATSRMRAAFDPEKSLEQNRINLLEEACRIREEEIQSCRKIGEQGLPLIEKIWEQKKPEPVNILTHCNAGCLACIKYGTATAPVYLAHERGIPVHVWVDETRPRNQGARLTAYELGLAGVPHTVIPDNAGGHLMQHGMVDIVLVGSDRTTLNGDVANKIGTYLKALAAYDNQIPFYVALPTSSIDYHMVDGIRNIPVEERSPDEVMYMEGWTGSEITQVKITPERSQVRNFGFDVTPARLITGLITENGICQASEEGINSLAAGLNRRQTKI